MLFAQHPWSVNQLVDDEGNCAAMSALRHGPRKRRSRLRWRRRWAWHPLCPPLPPHLPPACLPPQAMEFPPWRRPWQRWPRVGKVDWRVFGCVKGGDPGQLVVSKTVCVCACVCVGVGVCMHVCVLVCLWSVCLSLVSVPQKENMSSLICWDPRKCECIGVEDSHKYSLLCSRCAWYIF